MKESRLIEMSNKIEQIAQVSQKLIHELNNLKDLGIGTLETVKLLPGYKEAIEQLIENNQKKNQDGKEDTSTTTTGDSGSIITGE